MRHLKSIGFATLAIALSGCISTAKNLPTIAKVLEETTGQKGRECIYTSDIKGYGLRGNNVLTIDGRGRDYYIATFRPGCLDMATSATAIFGNRSHQICGGLSDEVIMGDSTCTIDKIFKFENQKAADSAYDTAAAMRKEAVKTH